MIELGNHLYDWIEKIDNAFAGSKTLFLIDDIIAYENLNKKRQSVFKLAISERYKEHSLWLLTQSYTAVPINIRRQAKVLYVWCPKNRKDWGVIHEDNDVIWNARGINKHQKETKKGKHTCLIMRIEHPRACKMR